MAARRRNGNPTLIYKSCTVTAAGTALQGAVTSSAREGMAHYTLEPLRPFGAIVRGLRLGGARPSAEVVAALALDAALHGFLVFRNHSLPGAELRRASLHLGAIAVAHSCHAEAVHCDILRLSNRPEQFKYHSFSFKNTDFVDK